MAKLMHNGRRQAIKTVAQKARDERSAYLMTPEYLAEIKRFRLMDDDFMSKCLEHAPECIGLKNSEEGRHYMCKAMEELGARHEAIGEARGEARGKREGKCETMLATARRMLKDGILALKDIARYSGLSLAQVKKLQASMA